MEGGAEVSKKIDLTGCKFGRLKVLYEIGPGENGIEWACRCDCGNWTKVTTSNLRAHRVKSCGCMLKEINATRGYKNDLTKFYSTYHNLRRACYDPESDSYNAFGAKGITFCEEWLEDVEYFKEWSLNNGYSPKAKLYRYDQNEGYSPDNCYWHIPEKELVPSTI